MINKNIGESLQSLSLNFLIPWVKLKFNIRFDHTNLIIRPQVFGRLKHWFCSYWSFSISCYQKNLSSQSTNSLSCFTIKHPFAGIDHWHQRCLLSVQQFIHCPLSTLVLNAHFIRTFIVLKLIILYPTFLTSIEILKSGLPLT